MTLNLKNLLTPGSGAAIPDPKSCTPGSGSHYQWVDVDGLLGSGPNYVICCSTTYADDCIINCEDIDQADIYTIYPDFDECTDTFEFKYQAVNDLDIGGYNIDCLHETSSEVSWIAGYSEDPNGPCSGGAPYVLSGTGTHDITLLDAIETAYGAPVYISPCRNYHWRYVCFDDIYGTGTTNPIFGICDDTPAAQVIPTNIVPPVGTCTDYTDVTVQFDFPTSKRGKYIFVLVGVHPDCPTLETYDKLELHFT